MFEGLTTNEKVGSAASEGPRFSIWKDRKPVEFGAYVVWSDDAVTRTSADAELTAKLQAAELFTEFESVAVVLTEQEPPVVVPPMNAEFTEMSKVNERSKVDAEAERGNAPTKQVKVVAPETTVDVQLNPRGAAATLSGTRNVNVASGAASGPVRFASTKVIAPEPPGRIVPGPVTESMPISAHADIEPEKGCE